MAKTALRKEINAKIRADKAPQRQAMIERIKTAIIFGIVVFVLGFWAGSTYTNNKNAETQHQVNQAVKTAELSK